MRERLEALVQEMLDKGIRYDEAQQEFEKVFITRALQRAKGSVGTAADLLGLHRNTVARKMTEYPHQAGLTARPGTAPPLAVVASDCLTTPHPPHRISSRQA